MIYLKYFVEMRPTKSILIKNHDILLWHLPCGMVENEKVEFKCHKANDSLKSQTYKKIQFIQKNVCTKERLICCFSEQKASFCIWLQKTINKAREKGDTEGKS